MSKPTDEEMLQAFIELWYADTEEEQRAAIIKHSRVLLKKYGIFDQTPSELGLEWIKRGGATQDDAVRWTALKSLLDLCRKEGIDTAFGSLQKGGELDYFARALNTKPEEKMSEGKIITSVTFISEVHGHHPSMPYGSEGVWLMAYADYLTIRRRNDSKDLLVIPWLNISRARVSTVTKGPGSSLLTTLSVMVGIGQVSRLGDPFHYGTEIVFRDEEYIDDFSVFFKTGGERNAERLVQQLESYRLDYRRRAGRSGRPS